MFRTVPEQPPPPVAPLHKKMRLAKPATTFFNSERLKTLCVEVGVHSVPKEEVTAAQRKKILSNTRHNQLFEYDTDHVYTFDFFQHLLDVSNYALDVKVSV